MTIFVLTKNRSHFWTLFWSKIWSFLLKNQVFGHFLRIRTSDLSKTWSETWDNCIESSNGSVVSRKILVISIIIIGSPDVFRLRKEPINSLSCVRASVRPYVRVFRSYSLDRSIFFSDFLHEVRSSYHFDDQ